MDSAPPRTTSAIATPLANVTVEEANLNLQNFELFGIGRLGDPTQGRGTFDVLAGARYRGLSSDLSVSLPIVGTIGPFSGDRSWWDLLLGGRYMKALHRRISVRLRGDAGTDVFNVQAGVDIALADWLLLGLQYKYVNFDHADGEGLDRRGATSPVSRRRCLSRRTQEALTWYLTATAAAFMPASLSRRTRSRRSIE